MVSGSTPKSLFSTQLHWDGFVDSPDIDQIPEIAQLELPVYWRETYSCLTPEVLPLLKQYNHVYIAGVFTDISVLVTAMEIFDLGVSVSVVGDCVATLHGEDVHIAAMRSLSHAIGYRHIVPASSLLKSSPRLRQKASS